MELKPEMFKKLLPLPVTLITTVSKDGVVNAAPYSCVMPVLRPLDIVALASALPRDTLANIRETGEFVVNMVGMSIFKKAMRCAKSYPPEVNELERVGLKELPSRMVKPPRVEDAIGWFEVKLEEEIARERYVVILGRVVCAEINDAYVKEGKLIESPLVLMMPDFRLLGDRVAERRDFDSDFNEIKF